jgi:chromosome segregation ATPase
MAFTSVLANSSQVIQGVTTAVITVLVIFVVIVAVGFALLARRRRLGGRASDRSLDAGKRANILLVRLDDSLKRNDDELGFAVAQFGEQKTREFSAAIASAKANLSEAFRLKQQLDDEYPDTEAQIREWTARIVHLCESAQASVEQQSAAFARLRALESDAPASLRAVRELIAATEVREPSAVAIIERLSGSYADRVLATVTGNVAEAQALLAKASATAESADSGLARGAASDVATTVQDARSDAQHAAQLLDAIDNLDAALAAESSRLQQLAGHSQTDLAEARAARDSAPDPDSGAAIGLAIAALEATLASLDKADPTASIDALQASIAALDESLASARNQAQRLEHARTALVGALLTARSQIATTRDFMASRRGGIGADARTRLAEAERLLAIAEAEADPVTALDTARSSATYSRDADALARYDVLR